MKYYKYYEILRKQKHNYYNYSYNYNKTITEIYIIIIYLFYIINHNFFFKSYVINLLIGQNEYVK